MLTRAAPRVVRELLSVADVPNLSSQAARAQTRCYAKKDSSEPLAKPRATTPQGIALEKAGLFDKLDRQLSARDAYNGEYYNLNAKQLEALKAYAAAQEAAIAPVRFFFLDFGFLPLFYLIPIIG